jgi:hypothetical protein
MVIKEPLQSAIVKVANGKVYMTGKRVFTVNRFINKFFASEKHKIKTVTHSKLGFAVVFVDSIKPPLDSARGYQDEN